MTSVTALSFSVGIFARRVIQNVPAVLYPICVINGICNICPLVRIGCGQGGVFIKKTPILYNALLLTAVNLLLRFVSTSFQVFISGRLGAAGVGLLQLVLSVGSMALTAASAGIRTASMYLTAAELGRGRKEHIHPIMRACFTYSMICSGAVAVVIWPLAPTIAQLWISVPDAASAIRLYCCFLPISCLCGVMTGYFTAAGKIGTLAIVEVVEQLFVMGTTAAMLLYRTGNDSVKACQSVIFGSGIGACVTLLSLSILHALEHFPPQKPFFVRKRLLHTAIPLALADDLKVGINTTENLMVPKRLALYTYCADPMALFGVVCGMVFPILMFPACIVYSLADLIIPEMARCNAAGQPERISLLSKKSLSAVLVYGCFFGGLLFLCAEQLCFSLYNNEDAGFYLRLYALLAPMLYCDSIIDAINKGLGQQKISVRYNILTAFLDVLFLYLLLPRYGMTGYFFSFLLTHLLNFILSLRLLLKIAKPRISPLFPIKILTANAVSICLGLFISGAWARSAVFALSYFAILALMGVRKTAL